MTHMLQTTDIWMILHGKVYDVTKFMDDHPGGPEILSSVAGAFCTPHVTDLTSSVLTGGIAR